jgi:hypothetical protein
MANKKISQLIPASSVNPSDLIEIVQDGYSKKAPVSLLGGVGESGFSGFSGATGPVGTSGFSGLNGINGSIGPTGASGFSGYSGMAGSNGNDGVSGFSGYSGSNGAVGQSGFSGYSGTNGTGTSGFSGFSGYSGFSGAPGASGGETLIFLETDVPTTPASSGNPYDTFALGQTINNANIITYTHNNSSDDLWIFLPQPVSFDLEDGHEIKLFVKNPHGKVVYAVGSGTVLPGTLVSPGVTSAFIMMIVRNMNGEIVVTYNV